MILLLRIAQWCRETVWYQKLTCRLGTPCRCYQQGARRRNGQRPLGEPGKLRV